jgi:hypothetical protein
LKYAFWQSLLQYVTLWHFVHCFGESGVLLHAAHVGVCGCVDDEAEASGGEVGAGSALDDEAAIFAASW